MRFFISFAVAAMAAVASANSKANPFSIPTEGYTFKVGEPTALTWQPTTGGTVSLILQWGAVMTGNSGTVIASSIENDGSYTWNVPAKLAAQPDYTIRIVSDEDINDYNYIGRFTVEGSTVSVTSSSASSTSASTSTESSTSATSTTTSEKSTSTSSESTTSSATTMATASSTVASTSASATETSESSSTAEPTSTSASSSASQSAVPTTNAGIANRVSGGMLALVAGALML